MSMCHMYHYHQPDQSSWTNTRLIMQTCKTKQRLQRHLKYSWKDDIDTVNVVIFAGGKFRENVGKTFHVWVIFRILLVFPSLRHMGFIFEWGNF